MNDDEEVILECAKHWFVLVPYVLVTVLAAMITLVVYAVAPGAGRVFLWIAALLGGWCLWKMLERSTDIWVVTNLRVIDEYGVISHHAKESPLPKVNNVSYHQPVLGRIFGYGSVQIQTASEMGSTTYAFVTGPRKLKETITQCHDDYHQRTIHRQAERLATALRESEQRADESKECPYCAETIKARAKICRYCDRELMEMEPSSTS